MKIKEGKGQLKKKGMDERRIIVTSDTHGMHDELDIESWPEADIFIHAGDFTMDCNPKELQLFRQFLDTLPIPHKVVVPGNHEQIFRSDHCINTFSISQIKAQREKFREVCHFLQFELVVVEGVRILGISRSPAYFDWDFDFAPEQGRETIEKYKDKVDILITHYPPQGVLDKVSSKQSVGSRGLLKFVSQIGAKYHIFGHIHQGYGTIKQKGISFYNAASVNRSYELVHDIFVIDIKTAPTDQQQQDALP